MTTEALVTFDHPQARQVAAMLEPLSDRFHDALAGILDERRLIQSVMIAMDRNRELFKCDPQSIVMTAMSAAVVGLEVDGILGQAFMVPFNVKGRGKVAQFMTGYKGYSTLAARGGFSIRGDVVREGDHFEYDKSLGTVNHRSIDGRGNIIASWARAVSNDLPAIVEVVGIDELLELRGRAKSTQGEGGAFSPWLDPKIGFPAMCAKTAKRRIGARSLPLGRLRHFGIAARIDEACDEHGLQAWASPDGSVQTSTPVTPEAPARDSQPPIIISTTRNDPWPELAADLARKVAGLVDWIASAESTQQLTSRWTNTKIVALKQQVKIMSEEAMSRLVDIHDKKYATLAELEEQQ